jgi:hypothetical protein
MAAKGEELTEVGGGELSALRRGGARRLLPRRGTASARARKRMQARRQAAHKQKTHRLICAPCCKQRAQPALLRRRASARSLQQWGRCRPQRGLRHKRGCIRRLDRWHRRRRRCCHRRRGTGGGARRVQAIVKTLFT